MVKIGVQMFTLRDHAKTPEQIHDCLKKVKAMGYDGIQESAMGPIDASELKKMLDDLGLECAASHVNLDVMKSSTQEVIDRHATLGCKYTAIGGFWGFNETGDNAATWDAFIEDFNATAALFKDADLKIGYHNHSHEFIRHDGKLIYQQLIDGLDNDCWFEVDTYWIAHGGGCPATWIESLAGRVPCVHYKDLVMYRPEGGQHEHLMTEIGDGNLNWPEINTACEKAGVEWYLVERDRGLLDPFESLERSVKNMRAMGL